MSYNNSRDHRNEEKEEKKEHGMSLEAAVASSAIPLDKYRLWDCYQAENGERKFCLLKDKERIKHHSDIWGQDFKFPSFPAFYLPTNEVPSAENLPPQHLVNHRNMRVTPRHFIPEEKYLAEVGNIKLALTHWDQLTKFHQNVKLRRTHDSRGGLCKPCPDSLEEIIMRQKDYTIETGEGSKTFKLNYSIIQDDLGAHYLLTDYQFSTGRQSGENGLGSVKESFPVFLNNKGELVFGPKCATQNFRRRFDAESVLKSWVDGATSFYQAIHGYAAKSRFDARSGGKVAAVHRHIRSKQHVMMPFVRGVSPRYLFRQQTFASSSPFLQVYKRSSLLKAVTGMKRFLDEGYQHPDCTVKNVEFNVLDRSLVPIDADDVGRVHRLFKTEKGPSGVTPVTTPAPEFFIDGRGMERTGPLSFHRYSQAGTIYIVAHNVFLRMLFVDLIAHDDLAAKKHRLANVYKAPNLRTRFWPRGEGEYYRKPKKGEPPEAFRTEMGLEETEGLFRKTQPGDVGLFDFSLHTRLYQKSLGLSLEDAQALGQHLNEMGYFRGKRGFLLSILPPQKRDQLIRLYAAQRIREKAGEAVKGHGGKAITLGEEKKEDLETEIFEQHLQWQALLFLVRKPQYSEKIEAVFKLYKASCEEKKAAGDPVPKKASFILDKVKDDEFSVLNQEIQRYCRTAREIKVEGAISEIDFYLVYCTAEIDQAHGALIQKVQREETAPPEGWFKFSQNELQKSTQEKFNDLYYLDLHNKRYTALADCAALLENSMRPDALKLDKILNEHPEVWQKYRSYSFKDSEDFLWQLNADLDKSWPDHHDLPPIMLDLKAVLCDGTLQENEKLNIVMYHLFLGAQAGFEVWPYREEQTKQHELCRSWTSPGMLGTLLENRIKLPAIYTQYVLNMHHIHKGKSNNEVIGLSFASLDFLPYVSYTLTHWFKACLRQLEYSFCFSVLNDPLADKKLLFKQLFLKPLPFLCGFAMEKCSPGIELPFFLVGMLNTPAVLLANVLKIVLGIVDFVYVLAKRHLVASFWILKNCLAWHDGKAGGSVCHALFWAIFLFPAVGLCAGLGPLRYILTGLAAPLHACSRVKQVMEAYFGDSRHSASLSIVASVATWLAIAALWVAVLYCPVLFLPIVGKLTAVYVLPNLKLYLGLLILMLLSRMVKRLFVHCSGEAPKPVSEKSPMFFKPVLGAPSAPPAEIISHLEVVAQS